jgi:hypothetical protein
MKMHLGLCDSSPPKTLCGLPAGVEVPSIPTDMTGDRESTCRTCVSAARAKTGTS